MTQNKKAFSDFSISLYLFLFFFLIYILTAGGHLYSLDGEKLFLVTKAMVEEGSFRIEDGNFSPYGLGPSFFAIPFYFAGKVVSSFVKAMEPIEITRGTCSILNSFVTALTCVVLFNLLRAFSISFRTTFLTAVLYGFGSLAWPYSKYFFPQALAGLCLLGGVSSLIQFNLKEDRTWVYKAGFCAGLLIFTRFEGILFLPLGAGYILAGRQSAKAMQGKKFLNLITFSIFPFIFILFSLIYNYIKTGVYLNPGGSYCNVSDFSTPLLIGLYGNILSPGKGLVFYMPVILLSIAGLRFFRYKREAVFISLIAFVYLLFYSKWWDWSGDWAWGPRLVVMLVPLFFIPVGFLLERVKIKSVSGILIFFISILSIFLQLIALPITFNEYLREVYRSPERKINFMNSEVRIRPHHFVPRLSPLAAQVLLIKERIELLREGKEFTGRDYYNREVHAPIFDFWYINMWRKAPLLKKYILGFVGFISAVWILVLCLIISVIKWEHREEKRNAIKIRTT